MKFQSGYTLLQLSVVLIIIGILATLAVPQYRDYTLRAKASEVIAQYDAAREYATIETNNQPITCEQFQALNLNHVVESPYAQIEIMHQRFDLSRPGDYHVPVFAISANPGQHGAEGLEVVKQVYKVMEPTGKVGPHPIMAPSLVAITLLLTEGRVEVPCAMINPHLAKANAAQHDQAPTPAQTSTATITTTIPTPSVADRTQDLCVGDITCAVGQDIGQGAYKPGTVCPEEKPWGMQYMAYDAAKQKTTFERSCADTDTCSKKWWQGTSDKSECRDPQDPLTSAQNAGYDMECSFCCTGNNCLSSGQGLLPPKKETWITTKQGMSD